MVFDLEGKTGTNKSWQAPTRMNEKGPSSCLDFESGFYKLLSQEQVKKMKSPPPTPATPPSQKTESQAFQPLYCFDLLM